LMLLASGRSPLTAVYVHGLELHIEGGIPAPYCTRLQPYLTIEVKQGRSGELSQRAQTATLTKENHCRRGAAFHHCFKFGTHPEEGDSLEISLWHSRGFFSPIKLASGRLPLSSFGRPAVVGNAVGAGGDRHQEMSAWLPLELDPQIASQSGLAAAGGRASGGDTATIPAAATVRLKLSALQPTVPVHPSGARASNLPPTYLEGPPADVPTASLAADASSAASATGSALPVATAVSTTQVAATTAGAAPSAPR
jgi:hypothetical protein